MAAQGMLDGWPVDLRPFATLLIEWVEEFDAEGQRQVWFRRKELFPKRREAVALVTDFWDREGFATTPP